MSKKGWSFSHAGCIAGLSLPTSFTLSSKLFRIQDISSSCQLLLESAMSFQRDSEGQEWAESEKQEGVGQGGTKGRWQTTRGEVGSWGLFKLLFHLNVLLIVKSFILSIWKINQFKFPVSSFGDKTLPPYLPFWVRETWKRSEVERQESLLSLFYPSAQYMFPFCA